MKTLKIFIIAFVAGLSLASCDKHELFFNAEEVNSAEYAEFQLHYFEPIDNKAAYYIDSVFVNDVLYSSVKGSGQLLPYNGVPGGTVGRFFSVKAGDVNFKFYRKDEVVYDRTVNLKNGKQNIIVTDMNADPIIIDNKYPYVKKHVAANPELFNSDSLTTIMFVNLLYEKPGVPYQGKLQYQYKPRYTASDNRTADWENVGEPVGFGEATERCPVIVVKTNILSTGSRNIDYRILTEDGSELQVLNSKGKMVDYSDYWTGYIGYHKMHFFGGYRTAKPTCSVKQWGSL